MSPSVLLICGLIALVIGIFGAFLNVTSFASGRRSMVSVFIAHAFCALFYIGGAVSSLAAIIMFLIDYAKH